MSSFIFCWLFALIDCNWFISCSTVAYRRTCMTYAGGTSDPWPTICLITSAMRAVAMALSCVRSWICLLSSTRACSWSCSVKCSCDCTEVWQRIFRTSSTWWTYACAISSRWSRQRDRPGLWHFVPDVHTFVRDQREQIRLDVSDKWIECADERYSHWETVFSNFATFFFSRWWSSSSLVTLEGLRFRMIRVDLYTRTSFPWRIHFVSWHWSTSSVAPLGPRRWNQGPVFTTASVVTIDSLSVCVWRWLINWSFCNSSF